MAILPCGIVDKPKVAFAIDVITYCFDLLGDMDKYVCVSVLPRMQNNCPNLKCDAIW